jgi:hypothetical protein
MSPPRQSFIRALYPPNTEPKTVEAVEQAWREYVAVVYRMYRRLEKERADSRESGADGRLELPPPKS